MMIRVEHLSKKFGENVVLKDVNCEIKQGEVISIIGPSGTGKSTFLRCLNLLEKPSDGDIFIDDVNILEKGADVPKLRQKMGMVFQSFNLYSHLTSLENLMLGPVKLLGKSKEEAMEKGRELLRMVGLGDKENSFPEELSGGQKQRIAIARCLAMEPEIILFDEPTSALDPTMVSEVLAVIRRLAKEGMTMAIVTHEMDFARNVSSRVFYMDEGIIYEDGSPAQIFDNPEREKTMTFINRIRGFEYEVESEEYDFYRMNGEVQTFCEKYLPPRTVNKMLLLLEETIALQKPPFKIQIDYFEKNDEIALTLKKEGDIVNPFADESDVDFVSISIIKNLVAEVDEKIEGKIYSIKMTLKK